jgi:phage terminase small subunit
MLNNKQRAFVTEYVKDWNGTQAAIRAGYSKRTANEQAAQLLAKLSIQEEIGRIQSETRSSAIATKDELCEILTAIVRANVPDYSGPCGGIDMNAGDPRAIQEHSQNELGTKLKMHSKIAAAQQLCKILGFEAPAKQEITGNIVYRDPLHDDL